MRRLLFIPLLLLVLSGYGQTIIRANSFYVAPAVATAGYCAEYQAVYDEYATPPHDTIAAKWNTFVETLVDEEVWDSIDVMWVFSIDAAANAVINWITPGTYSAVNNHSTAFVAHEGFTGDGANDYIDLNWNPNDNGSMFTLNRACFGVYLRTGIADNDYVETGGSDGTDRVYIQSEVNDHSIYVQLNNTGNDATFTLSGNAAGMKIAIRISGDMASLICYDNKSGEVDEYYGGASTARPDIDLYGCAWNNNGSAANFSAQQISLIFYGGFKSQTSVNIITDAFETVMDSNNKGVIP